GRPPRRQARTHRGRRAGLQAGACGAGRGAQRPPGRFHAGRVAHAGIPVAALGRQWRCAARSQGGNMNQTIEATLPQLRVGAITAMAIASALAVVLLSGCATPGPAHAPLARSAPEQIGLDAAATMPAVDAAWWKTFGDAQLDALVERALAGQ